MENEFLNGSGVIYLWKRITQKFASKEEISSLASSVVEGYFYAGNFYEDANRTVMLTGETKKVYIDISSGILYRFDITGYIPLTTANSSGGTGSVTGNGILETVLNDDYTLTIKFTDGTSYTTTSIRGEKGDIGEQGVEGKSAYEIARSKGFEGTEDEWLDSLKGTEGEQGIKGADGVSPTVIVEDSDLGHTLIISDVNGEHRIELRNGADGVAGNGVKSVVLNNDYSVTFTLEDGTSYTTASIRGEKGERGEKGDDGQSVYHLWNGTVLTIESANGSSSVDLRGEKGEPYELTDTDKEIIVESVFNEVHSRTKKVFYCENSTPGTSHEKDFFIAEMHPQDEGSSIGDYIIHDGIVYEIGYKGKNFCSANKIVNISPDLADYVKKKDITVPEVTMNDNGKFLRVVNGIWAAVTIDNAEGVGF